MKKWAICPEKQYKELTIKEFTKAADVYESEHAGIYEICKEDTIRSGNKYRDTHRLMQHNYKNSMSRN